MKKYITLLSVSLILGFSEVKSQNCKLVEFSSYSYVNGNEQLVQRSRLSYDTTGKLLSLKTYPTVYNVTLKYVKNKLVSYTNDGPDKTIEYTFKYKDTVCTGYIIKYKQTDLYFQLYKNDNRLDSVILINTPGLVVKDILIYNKMGCLTKCISYEPGNKKTIWEFKYPSKLIKNTMYDHFNSPIKYTFINSAPEIFSKYLPSKVIKTADKVTSSVELKYQFNHGHVSEWTSYTNNKKVLTRKYTYLHVLD